VIRGVSFPLFIVKKYGFGLPVERVRAGTRSVVSGLLWRAKKREYWMIERSSGYFLA
jgi:hypothetical protein